MNKRHRHNKNLRIIDGNRDRYNGLSVYEDDLSVNYLEAIERTIDKSLCAYPRTLMVRVELHLPDNFKRCQSYIMSRFIAALQYRIDTLIQRNKANGIRTYPCDVRYVWCRERYESDKDHYHVGLLLNNEVFYRLGDYRAPGNNLATMITRAWASALDIKIIGADVSSKKMTYETFAYSFRQFPKNARHYLRVNSGSFYGEYAHAFYRLSYFAKVRTKNFKENAHSFGYSKK